MFSCSSDLKIEDGARWGGCCGRVWDCVSVVLHKKTILYISADMSISRFYIVICAEHQNGGARSVRRPLHIL